MGRIVFPGSVWFHIAYEQGRFGGGFCAFINVRIHFGIRALIPIYIES